MEMLPRRARVRVRKAAAVSVGRKLAAHTNSPVLNEVGALTWLGEPHALQADQGADVCGIPDESKVDV